MANLSNINNKFLFTDGDFLKIGNLAPINNISGTESGISVTNSNVASITLDSTAASGKRYVMYSSGNGSLVFWDGDATSARLQIDTSGDITIGTTSNSYNKGKLTVHNTPGAPATSGTSTTNVGFRLATTTGNSQVMDMGIYNATPYGAWIQVSGAGAMQTTSPLILNPNGGNVGIGTPSPGESLEIYKDGGAIIKLHDPGNNSWKLKADTDFHIYDDSNSDYLTILNNGDVGIGTSTPAGKFEIKSAASNWTTAPAITFTDDTGVADSRWILGNIATNYGNFVLAESDSATTVNYSPRITVIPGGDVGIGIASPAAKLDVLQETRISYLQGNQYRTRITNTDGNTRILSDGAQCNIIFGTTAAVTGGTASEKMRINWQGNVGIGTDSPQNDKLHVETDTSTVYDGNSNQTGGLFVNNIYHEALNTFSQIRLGVSGASGASNVRLVGIEPSQAASDFAIVLRDGSVWGEKLRIKGATGDVGIGTDSPGQKLDVNGQMTHNGLVMKSGDGVYIDRYLAYTINISLIAFNWVDTGIYSNSGSYQLGASGTYAVQIYSNSHGGEPYWYDAYWSGIMSWHQGSVNQSAVFEIPLTQAAHSTNNRPLELRIQNTLGSGPGTPANNARLEVKTTAAGTNSVSLSFRFRRLI